ncbi:hypothetical protein DSM110093_00147 [Sulfitobacter sp. DSM 110093]|uniref:hypothetical protein n=1 Tax=Sulfitobacter sp. DSM 110093 TaxID=2883127 RepID=UPI001FADEEDF|nr:hypothetical protein [Sulfitobacter sp. DSM 110093]UOA30402.1 hypothetical protein DSM110093_00147 [Sulfitobacter sp. DSM 110093]
MPILIYEPDPLVCSDINETLSTAFPQSEIGILETFAIGPLVENISDTQLAVLSLKQEQLHQYLPELRNLQEWFPIICILNDLPRLPKTTDYPRFIMRPFSSGTLLSAVNAALSDQRLCQPEMP